MLIDNATRWNSTYYMLDISINLKEALFYCYNNIINKEFKKVYYYFIYIIILFYLLLLLFYYFI